MPKQYEVTVPLVVSVDENGNVLKWIIDDGFGGFFSDAEEASGVWDSAKDEWRDDEDNDHLFQPAWDFVRRHLPNPR